MTSSFIPHPSSLLFSFPEKARFGRILAKTKIYAHGSPNAATKLLFTRQVEKIIWQYKLAPETINIRATPDVSEIQVFSVLLKNGDFKYSVLRCIDQAIPFPILFELRYDGQVKPVAAYKRPSEADSGKWVVSDYFDGDWISEEKSRQPLPMVFDLEGLYYRLLMPLLPFPARPDEHFRETVERMERIRLKQRELERCETRLRNEKQFNRKVEINAELRGLKKEMDKLTRPHPAVGKIAHARR
jgi:hypothetical protein